MMKQALFAAVALSLVATSAAAEVEVESTSTPEPVKIRIELNNIKPQKRVELARRVGSATGVSGSTVVTVTAFDRVCDLPCTVKIDPNEDMFLLRSPPGHPAVPGAWLSRKHLLANGDARYDVRPGSVGTLFAGSTLATLGISGLITGGVLYAIFGRDPDGFALPILGISAGLTVLGIPLLHAGTTRVKLVR